MRRVLQRSPNASSSGVATARGHELRRCTTNRDVAERLSGTVLTERQTLAYLLREIVGVGRRVSPESTDTSPSNVDNLHRRGRKKVADARRVVEELEALRTESDGDVEEAES